MYFVLGMGLLCSVRCTWVSCTWLYCGWVYCVLYPGVLCTVPGGVLCIVPGCTLHCTWVYRVLYLDVLCNVPGCIVYCISVYCILYLRELCTVPEWTVYCTWVYFVLYLGVRPGAETNGNLDACTPEVSLKGMCFVILIFMCLVPTVIYVEVSDGTYLSFSVTAKILQPRVMFSFLAFSIQEYK